MTYPQPPGGQFPHGPYGGLQGGGFGEPPPKKNRGVIVAVVALLVLALGTLGITGFVAPGFFLSNETTAEPPGHTTTSSPRKPDGETPQDFLETLVDGLDTQDSGALEGMACTDADYSVDTAIDDIDSIDGATLLDSEERSDDEAVGTVELTNATGSGEMDLTIIKDDGDWCWQDLERAGVDGPTGAPTTAPTTAPTGEPTDPGGAPTAGGQPVAPQALSAMESFLDNINAGNAAKAKGALCADAISTPADVDELVGYKPDLEIDPTMDGITSGDSSFQLYLRGTAKEQELDGYSTNLWVTGDGGAWCVHAFRAVVI
jgi:hypothetical protein